MFLHPLECLEENSHERIASLQWCEQPCKLRRYSRKQTLPRARASRWVCMCVYSHTEYWSLVLVQVTRSSPVSFVVPSVSIVDDRSHRCSFDYWRCEFVVVKSREIPLYVSRKFAGASIYRLSAARAFVLENTQDFRSLIRSHPCHRSPDRFSKITLVSHIRNSPQIRNFACGNIYQRNNPFKIPLYKIYYCRFTLAMIYESRKVARREMKRPGYLCVSYVCV